MVILVGKNHNIPPSDGDGIQSIEWQQSSIEGGMFNGRLQPLSGKRMEAIFSYGNVAYVAECMVTS